MKKLPLVIISLLVIITLASCEFDIATETTVSPDGSLDKTIMIETKQDSARAIFNTASWERSFFTPKKVRTVSTDSIDIDSAKSLKAFSKFHKKFNSVEEANDELSMVSDTMVRVTSAFEKKFRWFYTYIKYSETYHKLNTLKLNSEDYFTVEDYAFIDRLPAEGQKISKADELYLRLLNNKAFDEYGEKALYEEYFDLASIVITTRSGIDSLQKHKEDIFEIFEKKKDFDEDIFLKTLDSLKIPINPEKVADFKKAQKIFENKFGFISLANEGKYVNRVNLPWDIVNSNADSVSGNSLFWAPPTIKFLLKDYTMYGECRKLNWWAVIVSVLFIGFTGYLFIRKSEFMIQTNTRKISIPNKE